MGATGIETLSTSDISKTERLSRWNAFVSDTYAVLHIQPQNGGDYEATIARICIGRLGLSWYETTASSGIVAPGTAGTWSAPVGDAFILAIQEHGSCTGHYLGREIVSGPGDMVLLDASRQWRVESQASMKVVAIKIPANHMLKIIQDPEGACGIRLGAEVPEVALAASLILKIKDAIEANPEADWEAYENVLIDIITCALHHLPESDRHPPKSGNQRREACAYIEKNLGNPDLNVSLIAAELGVSTRSIQRIFGELGFTPRGYIFERRIDEAAERLRRPDCQHLSITDIAYSMGFSDLSHFVRSFRRKFGLSPRDFRAAQPTPR